MNILEQRYSRFTDSYIGYLDKTNETALSILKITLPIIPASFAINVDIKWLNLTCLQWGFILLSVSAIFSVVFIGTQRKKYIGVEGNKLLSEIEESERISQKLFSDTNATRQYGNELLNDINAALNKISLLKNPRGNREKEKAVK